MACFLVPAAEAVIVTAAAAVIKAKEKNTEPEAFTYEGRGGKIETGEKISLSRKLGWLSRLLWGGCVLLIFEHIWHGEITAVFPFFTALSDGGGLSVMLGEMSTVGVLMSVIVTAVWLVLIGVSSSIERRSISASRTAAAEE